MVLDSPLVDSHDKKKRRQTKSVIIGNCIVVSVGDHLTMIHIESFDMDIPMASTETLEMMETANSILEFQDACKELQCNGEAMQNFTLFTAATTVKIRLHAL